MDSRQCKNLMGDHPELLTSFLSLSGIEKILGCSPSPYHPLWQSHWLHMLVLISVLPQYQNRGPVVTTCSLPTVLNQLWILKEKITKILLQDHINSINELFASILQQPKKTTCRVQSICCEINTINTTIRSCSLFTFSTVTKQDFNIILIKPMELVQQTCRCSPILQQ